MFAAAEAPKPNVEAYSALFLIEVGLRELVIEALSTAAGPRWWKSRIPDDIATKLRKSIDYERSIPWTNSVPLHPMYYTDFPDLSKIICRNDNWQQVFSEIFRRKDLIAALLSELEPIRNKVAHNRRVTAHDLEFVAVQRRKIVNSIGEARFDVLVRRCTRAPSIQGVLQSLSNECDEATQVMLACKTPLALTEWNGAKAEWWFDSDYLGRDLKEVVEFFVSAEEYSLIPRERGKGYRIESWVLTHDVTGLSVAAQTALREMSAAR